MIRLETHCHTRYSKDSLLLHSLLYMKCRLCHIDAIAICEHNNILGALKFKEYCSKRKNKVFVIVGEEIMTSSGEIIGLYLNEEIPAGLSCDETIDRIINQGGVVYVPHPYDEKELKQYCVRIVFLVILIVLIVLNVIMVEMWMKIMVFNKQGLQTSMA